MFRIIPALWYFKLIFHPQQEGIFLRVSPEMHVFYNLALSCASLQIKWAV